MVLHFYEEYVMTLTINLGEILTNAASICVIVGSIYGLWRYLKRSWKTPDPPVD
jgi:hypothetical protein